MALESIKAAVPWSLKIAAKILLSRLPLPYALWRKAGVFRDGIMDDPETAIANFCNALERSGRARALDGMTILELGPGDALSTAIIAHALGARASILIDAHRHATRRMADYDALLDRLAAQGMAIDHLRQANSVTDLLNRCNGRYLTGGLASLESLPAGSIDFAFSNAVLEHIRAHEFVPLMRALARVLSPRATSFHCVDLSDHLSYALNNLRFSAKLWESALMSNSGFYTNRLRMGTMLALFREAGLAAHVLEVRRFDSLPTARTKLAPEFRDLPEDELRVSGFDILLSRIDG